MSPKTADKIHAKSPQQLKAQANVYRSFNYVGTKETLAYLFNDWSNSFNINNFRERFIWDVVKIDFGITETDFVNTFQESGVLTNLADFSHHRDYQTYQLPNLKGLPRYVAFLDGKLINMYADEKTFNQFVTDLSAQNKEFLATQKQEEKQRLLDTQKAREEELNKRSRVRMSALVSGGTVQDQMYMPRLVKKQTETKQSVAP